MTATTKTMETVQQLEDAITKLKDSASASTSSAVESALMRIVEVLNTSEDGIISNEIEECITKLYADISKCGDVNIADATLEDQIQLSEAQVSTLIEDKEQLKMFVKDMCRILSESCHETLKGYKAQMDEKNLRIKALEEELAKYNDDSTTDESVE